MLVVRRKIPVDPDRWELAREHVRNLVDCAREQAAGSVRYEAVGDLTEPNFLRFFEQYEDAAAGAHQESVAYRRFVEALPTFAGGEIETIQFEAEDVHAASFTAPEAVDALE